MTSENFEKFIATKPEDGVRPTVDESSNNSQLPWVTVFVETDNGKEQRQIRYDQFVLQLLKKQSIELMLAHCAMGVCGEAGELADAIKKEINYGQEINRKNVVEELGDLRFYIQATMNMYGISEAEVIQGNANKLGKRYVGLAYSDEAARNRLDKI